MNPKSKVCNVRSLSELSLRNHLPNIPIMNTTIKHVLSHKSDSVRFVCQQEGNPSAEYKLPRGSSVSGQQAYRIQTAGVQHELIKDGY